jgi:hypothetical protein
MIEGNLDILVVMGHDEEQHRRKPNFTRKLLHDPDQVRLEATFELFLAIRDLFPTEFAVLLELRDRHRSEIRTWDDEDEPDNTDVDARFLAGVTTWTSRYGLSSELLDYAFADFSAGNWPSRGLLWGIENADGNHVAPPFLHTDPSNETREEFQHRAGLFHDKVAEWYRKRSGGDPPRLVKRNLEHFRWLAAHLVGGMSYEDIAKSASESDQLGLSVQSPKTVAGECRKVAELIGISLPDKPGPRSGRKLKPANQRARK